jgi:hypothetical protein
MVDEPRISGPASAVCAKRKGCCSGAFTLESALVRCDPRGSPLRTEATDAMHDAKAPKAPTVPRAHSAYAVLGDRARQIDIRREQYRRAPSRARREAAATVPRRAEDSFCNWPADRDLRFRNVVLYVAINAYLRSHITASPRHRSRRPDTGEGRSQCHSHGSVARWNPHIDAPRNGEENPRDWPKVEKQGRRQWYVAADVGLL